MITHKKDHDVVQYHKWRTWQTYDGRSCAAESVRVPREYAGSGRVLKRRAPLRTRAGGAGVSAGVRVPGEETKMDEQLGEKTKKRRA